ncbi:hypothetical protein QFZ75_005577 [Streptomyces sp. V3I8]|uniref:hypothetical protein n=1 Tax=Streptomyces sp. V3I8 TaxID=3042279 RepID=UPI0027882A7E|nr:hypothetical protein [Streptomyces sp. V3I8]MDQ1039161.1 hypothetical protein [Streptomyces sp. V3I8]
MDTERSDNDAAGAAAEDRPRRRRSPAAVASVAAAVLLVGGGGAYVAATASGGSGGGGGSGAPGRDGNPPLLALEGHTENGTGGTGGTGGTEGIAPGEPDPNGAVYRADGELPDGPSAAAVYRTKGEVTTSEVARLAKALGVAGTPKATGDAWQVGATKDGFGSGLRVSRKAPGNWTFSRFAPGGDDCKGTTTCANRSAGGTGKGGGSESSRGAAVDPVSAEAAKKAAAPVLKAVGQDEAKLDAGQLMDGVRVVNAEPQFGGLPTYGWTTGVQVGPDGRVVGGSGLLKTPAKGDTYPVLGASRTLRLLNGTGTGGTGAGTGDGRAGIGGCAGPVPLKNTEDGTETPCETSATAPKPDPIAVEDAVFGLAAHVVDGRQALVPSWLFEVRPAGTDDSYTVTHPAVDPQYLTAPRPTDSGSGPGEDPTARPGESGGGSAEPSARGEQVEGYSVKGKELTVRFTGGVCGDYTATADERGGTVKVEVIYEPWKDKVCIMIAKTFHKKVGLDEPLGDREVVGPDGKAVPPEKDLPDRTG